MAEPTANSRTSSVRRWVILAVKLLVVALLIWFVRGKIEESWTQFRQNPQPIHAEWMVLSAVFYILALLPEGLFWLWSLRALGQEVNVFETLRAYYIGHLGKYAPGKAMVVVLRAGLIHSHRVNTGIVVASVFLETLTMMAVGACIAVPVLAFRLSNRPDVLAVAGTTALAAFLPTLPPMFSRLAKLLRIGRSSPEVTQKLAGFDYRTLGCGWLVVVLGWLAMGASVWAMLRALDLPANWQQYWYLYTAIAAAAVVLGFAAIILPAGVVVREFVFTELLGPLVGAQQALIVALALRLAWLVAEIVVSVILYFAGLVRKA